MGRLNPAEDQESVTLRDALPTDAPAFVRLKEKLRMPQGQQTQRGGFLLGTSCEGYRRYIQMEQTFVAEAQGEVIGFSIIQKHDSFVKGEVWQKRHAADLRVSPERLEGQTIAYYEQLAFLPGQAARVYAKYIAFVNLVRALRDHQNVLATVVREPIYNRAAVPFLEAAGFKSIGSINEVYPEVGRIRSDIYHLERPVFMARLEQPAFIKLANKARARGLTL